MKGFRAFVLQDLAHVLPSKCFQNQPVWNCGLLATRLHTSAGIRRFWNFFEFTSKEKVCRDAKECPSSKDVVSSAILAAGNEFEGLPNNFSPDPNPHPCPNLNPCPSPRCYQLEVKSTPMRCLQFARPLPQDHLLSLLDGNPVPRTLKWKLKGYRTLRNEQAGDFAFVPGARTRDYDILPRNDQVYAATDSVSGTARKGDQAEAEGAEGLCLTSKAIESKEQAEAASTTKLGLARIKIIEKTAAKMEAPTGSGPMKKKVLSLPKLLTSSAGRKEDVKFLPVSKPLPDFPVVTQFAYQTQPAAQYSSRPPKGLPKPSAPILKRTRKKGPMAENTGLDRREEARAENCALEAQKLSPAAETPAPRYPKEAGDHRLPMEEQPYPMEERGNVGRTKLDATAMRASARSEPGPEAVIEKDILPADNSYREHPETSTDPARRNMAAKDRGLQETPRTDPHFAPRSNKQSGHGSSRIDDGSFESIVGLAPRQHPVLNIRHPGRSRTSPCAATHARQQRDSGPEHAAPSGRRESNQGATFEGNASPMTSGSSGSGSRKPPGSVPPCTARRSSSNSCCLLRKLASPKEIDSEARKDTMNRNPSSGISTSSRNPAPRECAGESDDSNGYERGRSSKPRRRKPERERPKHNKKESKPCKRYCCPQLQVRRECDFSEYQCPEAGFNGAPQRRKKSSDPTCMPQEPENREICTAPSKRRERPCKRERRSSGERRERCCSQERQSRQRRRSCQRQEPEECSAREEAREVCTKPRKRDPSRRERKCDDRDRRSAKCTGRRHYTQSVHARRWKPSGNVKRYSSLPAFLLPFVGPTSVAKTEPRPPEIPSGSRFYGKDSKADSGCKKSAPKCEREGKDPCKAVRGSCGQTREEKCKKPSKTCAATKRREDSCGGKKSKSEDFCAKRREQLCKDRRKDAKSDGQSAMERVERERREMEECKKGGGGKDKEKTKKGEKKATGLERVVSPCKQRQSKNSGSKCKFVANDVPYNCFTNTMKQDGCKLPNITADRCYSTTIGNEFDHDPDYDHDRDHGRTVFDTAGSGIWNFSDDGFGMDEVPAPIVIENTDDTPDDRHASSNSYRWFLPWFAVEQY